MKKFVDAQINIIAVNANDIIATSGGAYNQLPNEGKGQLSRDFDLEEETEY